MSQQEKMQRMHAVRLASEIDRLTFAVQNTGSDKERNDLSDELGNLISQNFPAITDALRFYAKGGKRF